MKTLILAILLLAATAFAGELTRDRQGEAVQGAAPNGLLSQTLTVYSNTVNMADNLWWGVYASADCKGRFMPTAAKSAFPQFTIPGGTMTSFLVNKKTPFVNFSGCSAGNLFIQ